MANISQAEWQVMQVLWGRAPLSAAEVCDALEAQCDWHPKTVRTLLGRLVDKGALAREKREGVLQFRPLVSQEECVREESRSFLEQCFGGALRPMLAHFIENEDLSPEDIAALRAKLDARAKQEKEL